MAQSKKSPTKAQLVAKIGWLQNQLKWAREWRDVATCQLAEANRLLEYYMAVTGVVCKAPASRAPSPMERAVLRDKRAQEALKTAPTEGSLRARAIAANPKLKEIFAAGYTEA
jgi:hypothetical protein